MTVQTTEYRAKAFELRNLGVFFLIVFGFAPLVMLGLRDVGGWSGLRAGLEKVAIDQGYAAGAWSDSWHYMGSTSSNPMGVEWFGLVMGLGFVLSFGYWCTDFLIVQRAMAADSMRSARRAPLVAAVPKMLFPFLVIVPGMIAIAMACGPTLFGDGAIVVVDGVEDADDITQRAILSVIDEDPDGVFLILLHGGGVKGRGFIDKLKKAVQDVVTVEKPKGRAVDDFIAAEFSHHKRKVTEIGRAHV